MKNVIVVGLGEIGTAIAKIENEVGNVAYPIDVKSLIVPSTNLNYDVMHICIPGSLPNFVDICKDYIEKYSPGLVIIHSTVPVGTTRKIQALVKVPVAHSPVRGVHPNLYEGIMTFTKYVGGDGAFDAMLHLHNLGIMSHTMPNSETTEMMKILDTTYYGWNILFAKEVKAICDEYNLDYDSVYKHPNETYNYGYKTLGKNNVVRPVLTPPEGRIGGHCVSQNFELLPDSRLKGISKELNEEPAWCDRC